MCTRLDTAKVQKRPARYVEFMVCAVHAFYVPLLLLIPWLVLINDSVQYFFITMLLTS